MRSFQPSLLSLILIALPGCGSDDATAPSADAVRRSWVGSLDGTDARIGLVREGQRVALYVCGGPTSFSATRWFRGDVRGDGAIEITSGGATVHASPSGAAWAGTLTNAAEPARTFRIEPAREGTLEDLYAGELDGGNVGVVVTHGALDAAPSMQGVFQATDGATFQVLPVRTVERTAQGLPVKVTLSSGVRELFVRPAQVR